jgi:hypothetical protein
MPKITKRVYKARLHTNIFRFTLAYSFGGRFVHKKDQKSSEQEEAGRNIQIGEGFREALNEFGGRVATKVVRSGQ